jgi:hypothetical protein
VEQKNWARVRELVGYYRYDTKAERDLLNAIWDLTMNAELKRIKPAALSRKILALTRQLEILAQADRHPAHNQPSTTASTPPSAGPFQMRQRLDLGGPIDMRQQDRLGHPPLSGRFQLFRVNVTRMPNRR